MTAINATPAAIIASLIDAHTCATPGNVAAVAELSLAFAGSIRTEQHRALIDAVLATLDSGKNCVGVEQYALAALFAKHRAAGQSLIDALELASGEVEALAGNYSALEDAALATASTPSAELRAFVFGGNSGEAGIGCITGDAGVDNSEKLTFSAFCEVVECYIADADDAEELRADFAGSKAALFAEYEAFYDECFA